MSSYSIKISGPDLVFERTVDLNKVNKVIEVCMNNTQSIANDGQIEKPLNVKPQKVERTTNECPQPKSLAEYYKEFKPKTNPDKILIFANYTKKINGQERFKSEELKLMFSKVGEKTPKNYTRDFNLAVYNGWLCEFHDGDGYYVTNSGIDVLANDFRSDLIKKTKKSNTRRSRKKTKQVNSSSKEE